MLWVGLAAALFAVLLFVVVFAVLPQWMVSGGGLTKEQLLKARSDLRTTGVQALGGFVLLLGAGVGAYLTSGQVRIAREGQITERFTRAIDQLGSEKLD